MLNSFQVTVEGGLTREPELRYTPSGTPVVNFTIASAPRRYNPNSKEWEQGETTYLNCTAWNRLAENIGASELNKGDRLIVVGTLNQRSFETKEGEKRTVYEMTAEHVGASFKFALADVTRNVNEDNAEEEKPEPRKSPAKRNNARR